MQPATEGKPERREGLWFIKILAKSENPQPRVAAPTKSPTHNEEARPGVGCANKNERNIMPPPPPPFCASVHLTGISLRLFARVDRKESECRGEAPCGLRASRRYVKGETTFGSAELTG